MSTEKDIARAGENQHGNANMPAAQQPKPRRRRSVRSGTYSAVQKRHWRRQQNNEPCPKSCAICKRLAQAQASEQAATSAPESASMSAPKSARTSAQMSASVSAASVANRKTRQAVTGSQTSAVAQTTTLVGALCKAALAAVVCYVGYRLAMGSYALLKGVMPHLDVDGADGAIALLALEGLSGFFLDRRRKDGVTPQTVLLAALLVVSIGVEVDLAIVREHAAVEGHAQAAVQQAHDQAIKDLDAEDAAAAKAAAAAREAAPSTSLQLDGMDRGTAHALGKELVKGQQATAAQQDGFRKERSAERKAYIEKREGEARASASKGDPWEMVGQVGMAIGYALGTAVAAAAISELMDALQTVLERLLAIPTAIGRAFLGWLRGRKGGAA